MNSTLNYPLYYQFLNCFTLADAPSLDHTGGSQSRWGLDSLQPYYAMQKARYGDVQKVLGNFVSNHDQARLDRVVSDPMLQAAMTLTMLTWVGIPIIYYGMEQDLPTQEFEKYSFDSYRSPLWQRGYSTGSPWYQWLAAVGKLRRLLPREDFVDAELVELWSRPDVFVFTRGRVLIAVTNGGSLWPPINNSSVSTSLTSWPSGTALCNVFDIADSIIVEQGFVKIALKDGESKLYAPCSVLPGTALQMKQESDEDMVTLIM
jgi:glycosidase